jgi:hypothetical protein
LRRPALYRLRLDHDLLSLLSGSRSDVTSELWIASGSRRLRDPCPVLCSKCRSRCRLVALRNQENLAIDEGGTHGPHHSILTRGIATCVGDISTRPCQRRKDGAPRGCGRERKRKGRVVRRVNLGVGSNFARSAHRRCMLLFGLPLLL